jgi:hypothetical protein
MKKNYLLNSGKKEPEINNEKNKKLIAKFLLKVKKKQ